MNYKEIKELIDLIRDTDLTEIEVERSGTRIRLRRESLVRPRTEVREFAVMSSPPPSLPAAEPATEPVAAQSPEGVVKSPLVGTFYRAPGPESRPYVEIGDRVAKGQVLCIIEAMKLMNEIESDHAGTIREILVYNGQPVEYGQPLFRVEPDA